VVLVATMLAEETTSLAGHRGTTCNSGFNVVVSSPAPSVCQCCCINCPEGVNNAPTDCKTIVGVVGPVLVTPPCACLQAAAVYCCLFCAHLMCWDALQCSVLAAAGRRTAVVVLLYVLESAANDTGADITGCKQPAGFQSAC